MVVENKKKQGQGGELPTPSSLYYEWHHPLLTKMTMRGPMSLMDVVDR
jgi:hypothetical protein